jgi:hypothetical protein
MNLAPKIATGVLAASACIAAVPTAAHATSQPRTQPVATKPMKLSCTTGGVKVTATFDYMIDGPVGDSVWYFNVRWKTSPTAKLDRLALSQSPWLDNTTYATWWDRGGKVATKNDVAPSGSQPGYVYAMNGGDNANGDFTVRLSAWGGKGDSDDSCRKTKAL